MGEALAFLEPGTRGHHLWRVGGVTALERAARAAAKAGATRILAACAPVDFGRALPVAVEFVAPQSAVPDGARVIRADIVADLELVDEASRRAAEWKLLRGSNKSFEGPVDALINWRFSMRITRMLAQLSLRAITPNMITIVAILVGLTAAALAAGVIGGSGYAMVALAGVLLEVNSILDSCDGELARLRFQYSKVGQWLDNLADDIIDNVFIAACGYGLGGIWCTIGFAAAGGRILVAVSTYIMVYRRTGTGDVFAHRWWFETGKVSADAVYDPTSPLTWLRSFGRRDTFVFVWMLACIAGFPHWVVGHGAVIAAVNVTILILHLTVFRGRR